MRGDFVKSILCKILGRAVALRLNGAAATTPDQLAVPPPQNIVFSLYSAGAYDHNYVFLSFCIVVRGVVPTRPTIKNDQTLAASSIARRCWRAARRTKPPANAPVVRTI